MKRITERINELESSSDLTPRGLEFLTELKLSLEMLSMLERISDFIPESQEIKNLIKKATES